MRFQLYSRHSTTKAPRSRSRQFFSRLKFEHLEDRKVLAGWAIGIDSGDSGATPALRNAVSPEGSVFVAGNFSGTTDFDPTAGTFALTSVLTTGKTPTSSSDAYIAKYDAAGALAWARKFGGAGSDVAKVVSYDSAGAVIVGGTFALSVDFTGDGVVDATSNGISDAFLVKLDAATGATIWFRTFGGDGSDQVNDVAIYGGQVYSTGFFTNTADLNPGAGTFSLAAAGNGKNRSPDAFVQRLDASGNFVTAWQMGGASNDTGHSLQVDNDGVYVLGEFFGTADFQPGSGVSNRTSSGSTDAFLARYSTTGGFIYAQTMGGSASGEGQNWNLALNGGSLVVTGEFWNSIDLDPGASSYLVTSGDSYTDAVVATYNKLAGSFEWADTWGQLGTHEGASPRAAVNPTTGNIYVGGTFYNTIDFTPAIAGDELTSAGDRDSLLIKYAPTGEFLTAWRFGGPGWDSAARPAGVVGDTVYVAGWIYPGAADFPSGDILTVTSGQDTYVAAIQDVNAPLYTAASSMDSTSDLALLAFLSDRNQLDTEFMPMKRKLR